MSHKKTLYDNLWKKDWKEARKTPGVSNRSRFRLILSCFKKIYKPGVHILDIGCGNGSLLRNIKERYNYFGKIVGTDISSEAIELAKQHFQEAEYYVCDPSAEPFPFDDRFQIATCCEVLEHIEDYLSVLKKIWEILEPGGFLLITVPHSMKHWGPHDTAVNHIRRFEKKELCENVEKAGFEIIKVFTWGSVLYNIYYKFILNKVKPAATMKKKSWLSRQVHNILYYCFYIDDLFINIGTGRMLILLAEKPK